MESLILGLDFLSHFSLSFHVPIYKYNYGKRLEVVVFGLELPGLHNYSIFIGCYTTISAELLQHTFGNEASTPRFAVCICKVWLLKIG